MTHSSTRLYSTDRPARCRDRPLSAPRYLCIARRGRGCALDRRGQRHRYEAGPSLGCSPAVRWGSHCTVRPEEGWGSSIELTRPPHAGRAPRAAATTTRTQGRTCSWPRPRDRPNCSRRTTTSIGEVWYDERRRCGLREFPEFAGLGTCVVLPIAVDEVITQLGLYRHGPVVATPSASAAAPTRWARPRIVWELAGTFTEVVTALLTLPLWTWVRAGSRRPPHAGRTIERPVVTVSELIATAVVRAECSPPPGLSAGPDG